MQTVPTLRQAIVEVVETAGRALSLDEIQEHLGARYGARYQKRRKNLGSHCALLVSNDLMQRAGPARYSPNCNVSLSAAIERVTKNPLTPTGARIHNLTLRGPSAYELGLV